MFYSNYHGRWIYWGIHHGPVSCELPDLVQFSLDGIWIIGTIIMILWLRKLRPRDVYLSKSHRLWDPLHAIPRGRVPAQACLLPQGTRTAPLVGLPASNPLSKQQTAILSQEGGWSGIFFDSFWLTAFRTEDAVGVHGLPDLCSAVERARAFPIVGSLETWLESKAWPLFTFGLNNT